MESVQQSLKIGPLEILTVIQRGLKHLEELNRVNETILKGSRRNGLLAWRPRGGKLQRADLEPWAARMPEGSHRLKPEWLDLRYEFLDVDGVPTLPDLGALDTRATIPKHAEEEYAREKLLRDKDALVLTLAPDAEFQGLDEAVKWQTHPAERVLEISLEDVCTQAPRLSLKQQKYATRPVV